MFLVCQSSPMLWLFYYLDGSVLPYTWLDNVIWFSTIPRMSGFLWNKSKWARWFSHFPQYTSGLGMLACSLNINLNHVIFMLQLWLSLNHQVKLWKLLGGRSNEAANTAADDDLFRGKMKELFGCILIDRYVTPATLYPGPEGLCWIFLAKCIDF